MIASPRAQIVHSMPGRLRLRFARGEAEPQAIEPLLAGLRRRRGVRAARFNPASGSVVVEYDPAALPQAELLGGLPVPPDASPAATTGATEGAPGGRSLGRAWWEVNDTLARISGGRADLRLLVPLALALLAIRELIRQGDLGSVAGHTLLWYSYNVFYHFYGDVLKQPPVEMGVG